MLNRRQYLVGASALVTGGLTGTVIAQAPVKPKSNLNTIYIKNMHCEGCAKRLRTRLYKLPGVLKVTTNVKQGVAVIVPANKKPVKVEQLWDATIAEKFVIMKVTTPNGTYVKRPGTPAKKTARLPRTSG